MQIDGSDENTFSSICRIFSIKKLTSDTQGCDTDDRKIKECHIATKKILGNKTIKGRRSEGV